MTIEVNPVGLRCGAKNGGLSCSWCYQIPTKGANNPIPPLNMEAITAALESENPGAGGFSLFGGEPLLAPLEDLEKLWALGLEKYGKNGCQTSGRPITEKHWPLFKKYKVCVAFSIEGPGELNDARWAGTLEETRRSTAHSISCLERCLTEGIPTGLITTLHQKNASFDRLPRLKQWLRKLDGLGLGSCNLHVLQHEGAFKDQALDHKETLQAMIELHQLQTRQLRQLKLAPFSDIIALLRGKDSWTWKDGTSGGVNCTWNACDPWVTPAVRGIDADGKRSLCQRVHTTPTQWQAAKPGPFMRQAALRSTPQDQGGCQGCRQMITCKGQCPGTALGGDWRKRSRDCEFWKPLLEYFEGVLLDAGEFPVTLRADRDQIEEAMAKHWAVGRAIHINEVLNEKGEIKTTLQHSVDHGDHTDHGDHQDLSKILSALKGEKVNA